MIGNSNDDEDSISSSEEGLHLLLGLNVSDFQKMVFVCDDEDEFKPSIFDTAAINSSICHETTVSLTPSNPSTVLHILKIDDYAFYSDPIDGRISSPILSNRVQIVNVDSCNQGLIAMAAIRKGEVIFTERAMEATQTPVSCCICSSSSRARNCIQKRNHRIPCMYPIKACQHCFRSLQPASSLSQSLDDGQVHTLPMAHLWPIAEYQLKSSTHFDDYYDDNDYENRSAGHDNNFDDDTERWRHVTQHDSSPKQSSKQSFFHTYHVVNDIHECKDCNALFCSLTCAQASISSCCFNTRAIQAITHQIYCSVKDDEVLDTISVDDKLHVEPSIILATKMFCHATYSFRLSFDAGTWKDPYSTFCGDYHDLSSFSFNFVTSSSITTTNIRYPLQHILHISYMLLSSILNITEEEQKYPLCENLYYRYISIAQRNGFHLMTQSPFAVYYNTMRNMYKDSNGSNINQQLATCLGSKDGKLHRHMDQEVDEKVRQ